MQRFVRLLLVLAAVPFAWYGFSLIGDMTTGDQVSIAAWLIGGLLVHDAVFAPACIAAGFGATKVLPRRWWAPVLAAASATVLLVVLALPVVLPRTAATRAPGDNEANTLLDRPYGLSLLLAIVVVWVLAAAIIARTHLGQARTRSTVE